LGDAHCAAAEGVELMSRQKRLIVMWIAAQLLVFSASAHAYLDPGTAASWCRVSWPA
jgi:hypothetical protein